jgi:hypothetical protein
MTKGTKVCPECGHRFKGYGWDGIDAHWRANHADLMPYEEAWPLISGGKYKPKKNSHEDLNPAAARIVGEATKDR